ncbi:hypothetical protein X777_14359 [Ooceraea biroi]|uniref:Uncharacterized protein n=1 Tax=Ooceraea biroi TaxID=2015173 RepID=A0A026WUU6_OOCBI|nr:hypothetical protein X777_14359 [Ooceraea biroi]
MLAQLFLGEKTLASRTTELLVLEGIHTAQLTQRLHGHRLVVARGVLLLLLLLDVHRVHRLVVVLLVRRLGHRALRLDDVINNRVTYRDLRQILLENAFVDGLAYFFMRYHAFLYGVVHARQRKRHVLLALVSLHPTGGHAGRATSARSYRDALHGSGEPSFTSS